MEESDEINLIRRIFNSNKFKALDVEEHEKIIDEIVRKGIERSLVTRLYNESLPVSMLQKDNLWVIMSHLTPVEVLKLCTTHSVYANYCNNQELFKYLIKAHYPVFEDFQNWESQQGMSYKDMYIHLTKTLTVEMCNKVKGKAKTAEYWLNDYQNEPVDIFDLLYNTVSDHDFGAIPMIYWSGKENILYEFFDFDFLRSNEVLIRRDAMHLTRRNILNLIKSFKDGNKEYVDVEEKIRTYMLDEMKIEQENYPNVKNLTVEQYLNNLLTLENRFQAYIINLAENVFTMEDIRSDIQLNMAGDMDILNDASVEKRQGLSDSQILNDVYYDDNQQEFLQLLHDAVRTGALKIFDELDCEYILGKLIRIV